MKNDNWEKIKKYLPQGWEEKAKETKALQRGREIKTADDLLALNLLYVTVGGSYQGTSEMMNLTANIHIDKNAAYYRIKKSGNWLKWMAENVCVDNRLMEKPPEWLKGRNVVAVDASNISEKGSKGSDYRIHYAFELFSFQRREINVTTIKEGEKLTHFTIKPEDIILGDRIYCSIKGIEYVKESNGNFVLRYRANSFQIYEGSGEKIDILSRIRKLEELESMDIHCFYENQKHELCPIRLVVMKKDKKDIEKCNRRLERKAVKNQTKPAAPSTLEINQYIILATSLDDTNEHILELYRARWQIEMVFYRLKQMLDLGEIPCKNSESVDAWFYGKLLLAALCEAFDRDSHFSPKGEINSSD